MTLSNYIEDDWDDNALSGRSQPIKDIFYQYGTSGAGDLLKGVYRPRWNVDSGSPSASNQQLELPDGSTTPQVVSTPSTFTTGSWKTDFQVASSTSSGVTEFWIMSQEAQTTPNNAYRTRATNDGTYDTRKRSGGTDTTLITGSWPNDTATHTSTTTRGSHGEFELFLDGTSQGTATDREFGTSGYILCKSNIDSQTNYDNLTVN